MDFKLVLAYAAGIIFLFFVGKVLVFPMKLIIKLVYNAILGGLALLLINLAGGLFGYSIAFNAATIFITGVLGIPGVILLAVLKQIF